MYMLHVALTSQSQPAPAQADAEQLEDRIWALATPDLGIQHLHAKAGPRRIDLAVYLAGPGPADSRSAVGTPLEDILALIPEWNVFSANSDGGDTAL